MISQVKGQSYNSYFEPELWASLYYPGSAGRDLISLNVRSTVSTLYLIDQARGYASLNGPRTTLHEDISFRS